MENFKYLIRIPNHLGDAIMAWPAVKAFLESNETETIALMMPKWAEPLYKNIKHSKIILLPSNRLHGLGAIYFQAKLLRSYNIENAVLLTPSFSSALIIFMAGIKSRFGYQGDNRNLLLNNNLKLPKNNIAHRSERYKLLLEKAGKKRLNIQMPQITVSDSLKKEAVELLEKNGINKTAKYIVIAPQAIAESRRWGSKNYSVMAGKLIKNKNLKIVLVGTADQYDAGQEITAGEQQIVNLCGKTDIVQAASILSGALIFIGNDSGLAHLASMVDIPLLVLSGADNPKETSPLSNKKTVIIRHDLECISCVKNVCPKSGEDFMQCMKDISVEEAFEIASKILNNPL